MLHHTYNAKAVTTAQEMTNIENQIADFLILHGTEDTKYIV